MMAFPAFFIQGGYTISEREQAELKYCESVRELIHCQVPESQHWALSILASDFMPLKHQESFWLNEAFRTNLIKEFSSAEKARFIVSTPAQYSQSAPHLPKIRLETEGERVSRPRVNIEKDDAIIIDGVNQSLLSYLKTNVANYYVYRYHDLNSKEQCRLLTIMNNVIDMDDTFKNEEWYRLTKNQAKDIYEMYMVDSLEVDCIMRNTSLDDVLNNAHKNCKMTSNKLLKKVFKPNDPEKTVVYTLSHMNLSNYIWKSLTCLNAKQRCQKVTSPSKLNPNTVATGTLHTL